MDRARRNNEITKIKYVHVIYFGLFILAIASRIIASNKLLINSTEASILLNITGRDSIIPAGVSIIESLLIRFGFYIFGEIDLAARIWTIIAGSLLVLFPLYLGKRLDINKGLLISVFFLFDPFMVANSIQVGSNMFAFVLFAFFLGAVWKKDQTVAIASLFLLLLSGRGLLTAAFLLMSALIFRKQIGLEEEIKGFLQHLRQQINELKGGTWIKLLLILTMFFLIIGISKIDVSLVLQDIFDPLSLKQPFYEIGALPANYLVTTVSYIPLYIALLAIIVVYRSKIKSISFNWIALMTIAAVIFITINPNHQPTDIIWASGLLIIYISANFPEDISFGNLLKSENLVWVTVLLIGLIALCMSFSSIIYQQYSGYGETKNIITFLSIAFFEIALIIISIYFMNSKIVANYLLCAGLIILSVIQIGFSIRASGLAGQRSSELLWSGFAFDRDLLTSQIAFSKQSKEILGEKINIGLIENDLPEITWELRNQNLENIRKDQSLIKKYDILLSEGELLNQTTDKYVGQTFVVRESLSWISNPIKALWSFEYWSWLIFRNAPLQKEIQYLWISVN